MLLLQAHCVLNICGLDFDVLVQHGPMTRLYFGCNFASVMHGTFNIGCSCNGMLMTVRKYDTKHNGGESHTSDKSHCHLFKRVMKWG